MIAIKQNETKKLPLTDYIALTAGLITKDELISMEEAMVKAFGFKLQYITQCNYYGKIYQMIPEEQSESKNAKKNLPFPSSSFHELSSLIQVSHDARPRSIV